MAQHVEDISEKVFGDCRAVIFVLESDKWKELFDGGLAHVQLLRHNIQPNSTPYRVHATSERTGQVVLNVVLDKDTKYEITQDISYHHLKTTNNVYSLKLSQDSNGMEFALVVQTIIRTIQENNPPSPKKAWMSPVVRQQSPPVVYSPLKDQLLSSPDPGKTVSLPPQRHLSILNPILSTSATSVAPSGRPPVPPRVPSHQVFEDREKLLCETLSDAISEGNVQKAIEATKLITEKGIQVTIRQKHPKSMLLDSGSKPFNIKVVVEDRETSGGKFEMKVSSVANISSLQQEVAARYGFPPKVQKWIIGRKMAKPTDTLANLNIKASGYTAFLYIVSSRNIGLTRQELENYRARVESPRPGTSYVSTVIRAAATQSSQQAATIRTASQPSKAASLASLSNPGQSSNTNFQTSKERTTFRREAQITNASQPLNTSVSSQVSPEIPMQRHENTNQATGGACVSRVANQPGSSPALMTLAANQTIGDIERMLEAAGDNGPLFPEMGISGCQESGVQPQGWSCLDCTFVNTPTRPGCEVCGANRPANYVVPQNPHISEQERLRLEKEREEMDIFQRTIDQQQQEQEVAREMNFRQLVETAQQNLIRNTEEFDCAICFLTVEPGEGVMLRECLHCFCEDCLREHIKNCTDPEVQCPFQDNDFACHFVITAQEIKALLQEEDFNKFLNRSLATAESQASNSFHCKTANCPGWCIYEDNSNIFHCPVCQKVNCLTCKAIHHPDLNCKEYQEDLKRRAQNDIAAKQTQKFLEQMIEKGEAMKCPQCDVILLKKDGCDWMRCSMCRLEICWATRGPRWGPMGVGDLSGGCKCRVGGKRCHPKCKNCH